MVKKLLVLLAVLGLGGCASLPDWSLFAFPGSKQSHAADTGGFDFGWRLSGDPEVAPLQVFDNGRRMWLQFSPGQALPAVFAHTPAGDRLVFYKREGAYVVLDRVWPVLLLRGGGQQSEVRRTARDEAQGRPAQGAGIDSADAVPLAAVENPDSQTGARQALAGMAPVLADSARAAPSAQAVQEAASAALPQADAGAALALATASDDGILAVPAVAVAYAVSPEDRNMRLALARWAAQAGWTFEPEHWSVDADIPIAGTARFEADFTQAVQALMAATELADRPLQPCFYSNKVLRIVPYAQACNRVAALGGSS